MDTEPFD
ncbi:hypothetical protein CFC21_074274, partial [Triticum aestivum]